MNKIEIIENLSPEKLRICLVQLLKSKNFMDIEERTNYISAIEASSFSNLKHVFIFADQRLSGNIDIDLYVTNLSSVQSAEAANSVIIVSQYHISNGFKSLLNSKLTQTTINYLDRDGLIGYIDKFNEDFWRHEDVDLLSYESLFKERLRAENELRRLHLPDDKYTKLLNLYIQPTLWTNEEDKRTKTFHRKRVDVDFIMNDSLCVFISGLSGSGKTTLLKNIGLQIIDSNVGKRGKLAMPIFLTASDLLDSSLNVNQAILEKACLVRPYTKLKDLVNDYDVSILVDSVDEFDESDRNRILQALINNYVDKGIKFYMASRTISIDEEAIPLKGKLREYRINDFNLEQIKRFVQSVLPNEDKANSLIESLRENKILEKLPITPLTLSLITIIYDEKDYEIPATVTDIYKQFNSLIIGRATVSAKLEYIDINFRERVLSLYGLYLLENENHEPMHYEEFIQYFKDFYKGKSLDFDYMQLEDVLKYILNSTGILYIKEDRKVYFAHDSYMEFYAAVEIFNHHRSEKEDLIVENFFDLIWQNVAVFYAGLTKDMDDFAIKINKKLKTACKFIEYISGIQGAGYLIQALYLSNNIIRKDIILTALDMVLETNEFFKKMTTINTTMLQNYKLPIVQLLNFLHFYEMFNSLTLKEPLTMSFEELKTELELCISNSNEYDSDNLPSLGYKLIELAFTLDSKRLNNIEPLEYVIGQKELLKDSNLYELINLSLTFLNKNNYKQLRQEVAKKAVNIQQLLSILRDDPTGKIRFSLIDSIHPNRRVKIFVEGKSDAIIIEHAFFTLTGGKAPYWNIKMATSNGISGSAHEVTTAVEAATNYIDNYDYIIGVYDHDAAGIKEFKALKKDYDELEPRCIKKRKTGNIFLLCLPIPGEMIQYEQEKQELNFFEIEHYFGHEYLQNKNMLKSIPALNGIFEIKDNWKTQFANNICKESDPEIFRFFVDLFKKIDYITGTHICYEM